MRKAILWILAFLITVGMAVYQRLTGPTYPVGDSFDQKGMHISYKFTRSHGGEGDQEVSFNVTPSAGVSATLYHNRYPTDEPFVESTMLQKDNNFVAFLPHQPPAGKLAYFIMIQTESGESIRLPEDRNIVTRFKGDVPVYWLLPHVIIMFVALLLAVRAGIGLIFKEDVKKLVIMGFWFLLVGGMILGPIVQKFAFDAYWTGVPFGYDLTDNKTLIAFAFWGLAFFLVMRKKSYQWATALAVLVMLAVYLIPHSVWGSEFDYAKGEVVNGNPASRNP